MSRTYRRLDIVEHIAKHCGIYENWQVHNFRTWFGYNREEVGTPKYPGKEAAQKLAEITGDHGYRWHTARHSKWFINSVQRTHRAQASQELAKYKKNEDYEVIIPRKKLLPYD